MANKKVSFKINKKELIYDPLYDSPGRHRRCNKCGKYHFRHSMPYPHGRDSVVIYGEICPFCNT